MTEMAKPDARRDEEQRLLEHWEALSQSHRQQRLHVAFWVRAYTSRLLHELADVKDGLEELKKLAMETPGLPTRLASRLAEAQAHCKEADMAFLHIQKLLQLVGASSLRSPGESERTEFQTRMEAMLRTAPDQVMRHPHAPLWAFVACTALELEPQVRRLRFHFKRVQGAWREWDREPGTRQVSGGAAGTDAERTPGTLRWLLTEWWDQWRDVRDLIRNMRRLWYGPREAPTPLDVQVILKEVLGVTHAMSERPVRVETDFTQGLPGVYASRARLWLVFRLLVEDARLTMNGDPREGHVLQLRTRREGNQVRVDVSDTGGGLTAENLSRLFEPFHRRHGRPDTGLRIPTCEAILQSLGGELRLEAVTGGDVTFSVLLPSGS
jgi:hypothetical protein